MTIRNRLLIWYTAVFATSAALLMVSLYFLLARQMKREYEKFLRDEYAELAEMTADGLENLPKLKQDVMNELANTKYFPTFYRLYDSESGAELITTIPQQWPAFEDRLPRQVGSIEPALARLNLEGPLRSLLILTGRPCPAERPSLVLQTGMYTRRLAKRLARLRVYLAAGFVVSILLAAAGGRFLAGRSLEPFDKIVFQLESIESGSLSTRLPVAASHDEVERLQRGINHMLERLDRSFEQMKGFTADAAHELRTPLAALRCNLEVAAGRERTAEEYRNVLSKALEQCSRLNNLVNNLLVLAQMDVAVEPLEREPVAIDRLFDDIQEPFRLLAEQKGLALHYRSARPVVVPGNSTMLRQLLCNLLDNAIRYTPAGGTIEVDVQSTDAQVVVSVCDTGIGIPPDLQEKIFDRFFRVDPSRSREAGGVGLGLSICQKIVELHGGSISLQSREGGGATFAIALPLAKTA